METCLLCKSEAIYNKTEKLVVCDSCGYARKVNEGKEDLCCNKKEGVMKLGYKIVLSEDEKKAVDAVMESRNVAWSIAHKMGKIAVEEDKNFWVEIKKNHPELVGYVCYYDGDSGEVRVLRSED